MNTATEITTQSPLRAALERNQKRMAEIDEVLGSIESTLGMLPVAEVPKNGLSQTVPPCCDSSEINTLINCQGALCDTMASIAERLRRVGASLKQMF